MSTSAGNLTLVLGGARSGKSRFAEGLVTVRPAPWTYIATAEPRDAEMAQRIATHRARRHEGWTTIEAANSLPAAVAAAREDCPVLIDCLTLWLSNRFLAGADANEEIGELEQAMGRRAAETILVSNEVGSGIVPDNALGRRFRDLQGLANQRLAARAGRVVLVVAGLPLFVKGAP
jgi:adenosylcobinamide kinase/adenosylcobinamide-phosphate guanylyltransferase